MATSWGLCNYSHGHERRTIPAWPPRLDTKARTATPRAPLAALQNSTCRCASSPQRETKTLIVNGRGNEVSEGGLAIFVGMEARLGERLWVEFTPPYSSEPLRVPLWCAIVRVIATDRVRRGESGRERESSAPARTPALCLAAHDLAGVWLCRTRQRSGALRLNRLH